MICQTSSSDSERPGSFSPEPVLPPPRVRSRDSSWAEELAHVAVDGRLDPFPLPTTPPPAAPLLPDAAAMSAAAEVELRAQLPAPPLILPGQAKHVATAVVAAAAAR